ncbi:unnamed protein product, partial [Closterium sp. Naga37s-1]
MSQFSRIPPSLSFPPLVPHRPLSPSRSPFSTVFLFSNLDAAEFRQRKRAVVTDMMRKMQVDRDPDMMRKMQVDRGAIKPTDPDVPLFAYTPPSLAPPISPSTRPGHDAGQHYVSGTHIPGREMGDGIPVNSPVAIFAEGKENALAIGYTKMSSDNIRKINKGIGVILMHYLNDGLWK